MKQVLIKKRKYGIKDFMRVISLVFLHYLFFYMFFVAVFGIHYALNKNIFDLNEALQPLVWYSCVLGPGVNALLHVWYSERGLPWVRLIMWLHTFFILFAIPSGVFM